MSITRHLILGLAASAVSVPAVAQTSWPAPAAASQEIQLAQSAYFSIRNTQDLLNRLGYDAGPADGIMGNRTRSAIMAYQRDYNLPATGEADGRLYQHLLETYSRVEASPSTGRAQTTADDVTEEREQVIIDVQAQLRRRGYDIPSISGQADAATLAAVMAYQQDAGLPVSGDIDEALIASLRSSDATRSDYERSEMIRDIQLALNRQGYDAGPPDGTLSPLTKAAIRTYQADHGMPITGEPSQALLAQLEPASAAEGGTATAASGPAESDTVTAVQEELKMRGYLEGEADGVMGAATSAAIRNFERDAGLQVTGTASPSLLATLRASDLTRVSAENARIVAEIEEALRQRGYAVGQPDGQMDAETAAAIRAFQRDANLPVTGEPSADLLATIRGSNVTAGPATPEEALQGVIQGTTNRLLDSIGKSMQQPQ